MTADFESSRPLLLGLAYRMLGSMWDAEDVVQEAYLRWAAADRSDVLDARAYLATIVSRLALDQLRSAKVRRQSYPGQWLPEPISSDTVEPVQVAELRDTLSYATLHMMERLSPPERVVLVLRDAFDMPYDKIAPVVGSSAATCRQSYHRAVEHLSSTRMRHRPSKAEHQRLLDRFLSAAETGNLTDLLDLLAGDVKAWTDGGGKVRAALKPIEGAERVARVVLALGAKHRIDWARSIQINGEPAIRLLADGIEQVLTCEVRDGFIHAIFVIRNPDKLRLTERGSPLPIDH